MAARKRGVNMLKKAVARLLPRQVYGKGRTLLHRYRRYERQRLPQLSESGFHSILENELGVGPGAVVFVHSSVGRMNLGFSFYRILAALREVVGEGGTLLFPSTHLSERPEDWLRRSEVFDVEKTPTSMGIIAEFARRQREAIRSLHPTHSVVAIGRYARELTAYHAESIYPCGEESPYYRMVHYDGLIIGIGVSTEVLTFVHCVEDRWKDRFPVETRDREVYEGRVRTGDGSEHVVKTLVAQRRIRWRNISGYVRRYIPAEVCRNLKIGGVNYYTARSKQLYAKMEELASRDITIYPRMIYRESPFSKVLSR